MGTLHSIAHVAMRIKKYFGEESDSVLTTFNNHSQRNNIAPLLTCMHWHFLISAVSTRDVVLLPLKWRCRYEYHERKKLNVSIRL